MNLQATAAKIWAKELPVENFKIKQRLSWDELILIDNYRTEQRNSQKFNSFLSFEHSAFLLKIPKDIDEQIEKLFGMIKVEQMALYRNYDNDKAVVKHKKSLKSIRKELDKLELKKSKARKYTLDHKIDSSCSVFEYRIRVGETTLKDLDVVNIVNKYYNVLPGIDDIRILARSDWFISQSKYLNINIIDSPLSIQQHSLLQYVNMYKNIGQSEDPPKKEILNDDDALDGWMHVKSKSSSTKKQTNKSKHADASNTYHFAANQQEADEIYLSNDGQAKLIQQQQLEMLKKSRGISLAKQK